MTFGESRRLINKRLSCVSARRLNEYIRHYEPLSYPTEEVHRGHLRAKRSVTRDNSVTLKFRSHGRDFHIRLKRDLNTFSNNLVIEGPTGHEEGLDTSHIYEGHLIGKSKLWSIVCIDSSSIRFSRQTIATPRHYLR